MPMTIPLLRCLALSLAACGGVVATAPQRGDEGAAGSAGAAGHGEAGRGGGSGAGGETPSGGAGGGGASPPEADCGALTMATKIPTAVGVALYPEDALPKGDCSAADACVLRAVATCPCNGGLATGGTRDYSCTCVDAQWTCALFAQGATACFCSSFADGGP